MKVIKKILTGIGILFLLFVGIVMIADSDKDGTYVTEDGTEVKPGNNTTDDEVKSGTNAADDDEVKSGESTTNEGYYSLVLENGEKVDILIPQTIFEDKYNNLNEQRKESIFSSIYNYDNASDVYVNYIPNTEQTLKEMLKEPYAVGSVFNLTLRVTGGPVDNVVSGDVEGDDSVNNLLHIDTTYIGDEKHEFMNGDIVTFDAVYAGLDTYSTPTFISVAYTY